MNKTEIKSQKLEELKSSFRSRLWDILEEKELLYVVSGLIVSFFLQFTRNKIQCYRRK